MSSTHLSPQHSAIWSVLTVLLAIAQLGKAHITISVKQERNAISPGQHAARAVAKRSAGFAVASETLDGGFWFGSFDVGKASNLSLLIDTGSADTLVDPGLYQASSASVNFHENGTINYATAQPDGCGLANISYNTFQDNVTLAGLTAHQYVGSIINKPEPNNETITVLPHQGIVGFSAVLANETSLGGVPFFWNLCQSGAVKDCRFGLALDTNGTGQQILGGIDENLFQGSLQTTGSQTYSWQIDGGITVNSTVVQTSEFIVLDSGTANIVGPYEAVKSLFQEMGIQAVEQPASPGCVPAVFGHYPCDKVPEVGLVFGNDTQSFNVEKSAFPLAKGGQNNCTSTIVGLNSTDLGPLWIFGQAWMQGKYVDFQQGLENATVGVATLKGYANSTSATKPTFSSSSPSASSTSAAAGLLSQPSAALICLSALLALLVFNSPQ